MFYIDNVIPEYYDIAIGVLYQYYMEVFYIDIVIPQYYDIGVIYPYYIGLG